MEEQKASTDLKLLSSAGISNGSSKHTPTAAERWQMLAEYVRASKFRY